MPHIQEHPEVMRLMETGAHLLVNVSGGADSDALLTQLWHWYQRNQHRWTGQFYVIHAHLGRNEWRFTLPHIQEYVTQLTGQTPIIVAREQGDLLARWWQRYETLQAQGRDVPPWSSAKARFCSGELKEAVISRWIRQNFPRHAKVISTLGIRADESPQRRAKAIFSVEEKASAPTKQRYVYRWLPIHDFSLADVWQTFGWSLERLEALRHDVCENVEVGDEMGLKALLEKWQYRQHPSYALGNRRVSCSACILASKNDLHNGIAWEREHFHDLVELELTSGFSFQPKQYLADLRPDLLSEEQRQRLQVVKEERAIKEASNKDVRASPKQAEQSQATSPQQLPLF